MRRSIWIGRAWMIVLLAASHLTEAQMIDNTASFRTIDEAKYLRLHYENDFFTATDYYYSQGITLEFVHPWFDKGFLNKLLISGKESPQRGIAVEHNGFTPTSTESDSILFDDRPYAATLTMRAFSISRHEGLGARVTSALSLGVIGPAAGGKAMQSTIHQWIDDDQPKGWEHQVQNDVVLNYSAGLEKSILSIPSVLLVDGFATAWLGTLNAKLSTGLVMVLGKLNPRLSSCILGASSPNPTKTNFSFHGYVQPFATLVGYDATLQGGLFNKSSPYVIAASQMERITFQINMGLVMQAGPVNLEYFFTFLTREFESGESHTWGGVRVGVSL